MVFRALAHAVLVARFGLIQVSCFPAFRRIAHNVEIRADSFTYVPVPVVLLGGPRRPD